MDQMTSRKIMVSFTKGWGEASVSGTVRWMAKGLPAISLIGVHHMPGKVLNKRLFETIAELCAALAILHAPDGLALHNLGLDEEEVTAFSFSSGCVLSPSVQHKYCIPLLKRGY